MTEKPHSNNSPERLSLPSTGYMTDAEIDAFEAEHNLSPWIAALLNVLPGAGYLYSRKWKLGLAVLVVMPLLYVISPRFFLWSWVLMLPDAYYCARLYNGRIFQQEWHRRDPWQDVA